MTTGALDVLARIRAGRPEPSPYEQCELCSAPVASTHQHLVSVETRSLLCACRPCYLLFTRNEAHLAYRSVPDRFLALPDLPLPVWESLQLPVGTAFMFLNSVVQHVVALYPGPAGATESSLELETWEQVVAACPALSTMAPDVEALLVRTTGQRVEAFLVPIDTCYELVGTLRALWRGFDGGSEVRARLDEFFDDVRERAR